MAVELRKISSGDEGIDDSHKQLVELATAISALCEAGDYHAISEDEMLHLFNISTTVFDLEQAAMEGLSYLRARDHLEEHEILVATIQSALGKVKTGSPALIKDAVSVMLFSISGHIETMDIPLADQISKKIRTPAVSTRRSFEPVHRPLTPPTPNRTDDRKAGNGGDDGASIKTIIVNSYASALLDLRASKGITGERAKTVAYEIVARAVNKATGKKISADFVKQIIISK